MYSTVYNTHTYIICTRPINNQWRNLFFLYTTSAATHIFYILYTYIPICDVGTTISYIRIYIVYNIMCVRVQCIDTKVVVIILHIHRPNRASPAALPIYYRCRSRLAVAINQRSVGRLLVEKKITTRQEAHRTDAAAAVSRKYIIILYFIFFSTEPPPPS